MKRLTALLAALVALTAPAAAPASAETIFEDDFETGTLDAWDNVNTARYAITSDRAHVRSGNFSLESTIPEGPGWGEINK